MSEPFYITTAISYPNGAPHIGHAYELIASDVIARFARLDGKDVLFVTGTDEHGLKMQQTAARDGITPMELVERNSPQFMNMAKALNSSHDDFIRTTEPRHIEAVQALWAKMQQKGDIYLDQYAGWYSVRDEAFYAESETTLLEDGTRMGPQGTPVTWTEEASYFFKLSAYGDILLDFYEKNPTFIQPESRKNEVVSFVKGGLRDLSISRTTFDWGIEVPDANGHVMYVWVDALTNYISACGYPDENHPKAKYWPANVHIIGKDIVRFHAVYWPAFLMSAGLPLPKAVFGHGFLFNRGEKMSKSTGNVVDPIAMAEQYGVDAMRYFFLREVPFGQDGSYSHEAIVNRINADLANDLGNLAQRSLSMIAKNCGGVVPQRGTLTHDEQVLLQSCYDLLSHVRKSMDAFMLHEALNQIWSVVGETNRYFTASEPWALKKTDPERMASVLYVTAEVLRNIGIMTLAFIPTSAHALLELLAVPIADRSFAHISSAHALQSGAALPSPVALFPRYVEIEQSAQQ